mmetsp:Transcript_37114/g.96262  ORF Transcript_37114/g.96262 Transcript_37114/m.96262 type:complete len:286 (-) Transcript_37114:27-884(-)
MRQPVIAPNCCSEYTTKYKEGKNLVHLADEAVDLLLTVTSVTTLNEGLDLLGETTTRGRELEGPEEAVHLSEVGAAGVKLVNDVLNTHDTALAKVLLNNTVVSEGNAVTVDLSESSLVDKLTHRLKVGETKGYVGLDLVKHVEGSLVHLHEHTVVELAETKKLKNLPGLRGEIVDTADTDDKHHLCLGLDEEVTSPLSLTAEFDGRPLLAPVLSHILLGPLGDILPGSPPLLLGYSKFLGTIGLKGLYGLSLLENALGDVGAHGDVLGSPKHKGDAACSPICMHV